MHHHSSLARSVPPASGLLVLAYLGFVSLGLPDSVLGVAWPSVRETFALPQPSLGWVSISLGCGYFASSFLAGRLIQGLGVGALLAASTVLVAAGVAAQAAAPWWLLFVGCAALVGIGSGAIDAGLNTYVASHFPPRHVNWLHACYSLGATLGPLVMTAALSRAPSWRGGYGAIAAAMAALACLFVATRRRWSDRSQRAADSALLPTLGTAGALRHAGVWLQMAVFFVYTGLEIMVGQWSYTLLTEGRGVRPAVAGAWVGAYFGSIFAGRVLFGFVAETVGLDRLVRLATAAALAGALLFAAAPSRELGLLGLVLLGGGLSPVFPCLMARTPQRLGAAHAAHAIGFQVGAAILGAASAPAATGLLIDRLGLEAVGLVAVALSAALTTLHEALLARDRRFMSA